MISRRLGRVLEAAPRWLRPAVLPLRWSVVTWWAKGNTALWIAVVLAVALGAVSLGEAVVDLVAIATAGCG